jgi:hypothetical protein
MTQHGLVDVDHILGILEIVAWIAAVASLIAFLRLRSRSRRIGLALALIFAATLLQPWGVVSTRVGSLPARSRPLDASAGHRIDVAGVPLFWFRPYVLHKSAAEAGEIDRQLKIRSWVVPFVLTNGSVVTWMCGGGENAKLPCVDTTHDRSLRLMRAPDGTFYYTMMVASRFVGGQPTTEVYRLSVGVDSVVGLAYWCLLAVLGIGLTVRRSTRSRHERRTSAEQDRVGDEWATGSGPQNAPRRQLQNSR